MQFALAFLSLAAGLSCFLLFARRPASKGKKSTSRSASGRASGKRSDKSAASEEAETEADSDAPEQPDQPAEITFDLPSGGRLRVTVERLPPEGQPGKPETLYQAILQTHEEAAPRTIVPTKKPAISPSLADPIRTIISTTRSRLSTLKIPKPVLLWSTRLRGLSLSFETTLFILALIVYTLTRFIKLESYPIYFFTDEAVQTVLAADFVRDGLRDYEGVLFPTYFKNAWAYNLNISVYVQLLPYLLFGKSIFVTRATSVLITLTGVAAVGLILKRVFKIRFWWVGTLLLSITPAWFLHSRTAFETALLVTLYVWFIYFYLLYRTHSPRYLHLALLFAALTFYCYSAGRLLIAVTGIMLLISDFRYHWENRRTGLLGILVIILLTLPYVRFQLQHPGETYFHLRMLDSYWLHDIPLSEKIQTFLRNYLRGISPGYWYIPNKHDLVRHLMKGYGHISSLTLPFALIGLVISLRSIRSGMHRVILIACLSAPVSGAIATLGIPRVLPFVIPAAIFTALGVDLTARWLVQRLPYVAVASALFIVLSLFNFGMLRDALVNGPTWYTNYGLGGMQYGAQQVFGAVEDYLEHNAVRKVIVSPTWANGTDSLKRFFLPDNLPVHLGNANPYLNEQLDLDDSILFVLTAEEYNEVLNSEKITDVAIDQTLAYPDGREGFFFLRMQYAPGAEAIFAEEREARQRPITEEVILDGQPVQVQHPLFEAGTVANIFDDDTFTLVRTYDANPTLIILDYPEPQSVNGAEVTTGSMDFTLTLRLHSDESEEPIVYTQTFTEQPPDPTVDLPVDNGPVEARRVEIEIFGLHFGTPAKIHVREINVY
jgi:hypothetical protein